MSEARRKNIWSDYWHLDYQRRHDWLYHNVKENAKKIASKGWDKVSRRNNSRSWFMSGFEVCKVFFLHTLGYTTDSAVTHLLKVVKQENGSPLSAPPDQRGRKTPPNKYPEQLKQDIIDFIERHRPVVSHYRLEHAPNRRYLPAELSITQLHRDFIEDHDKCSYSYFFGVFTSLNISFSQPENDMCEKCELHKQKHPAEEVHNCLECGCDICLVYTPHRVHAAEARDALHFDTELMKNDPDKVVVVTADMQKVIQMPKIPTKEYFFSRKLILFNETFATPGKDNEAICVLWHEGEAGRKAFNIANAYHAFANKKRNVGEIIMFTDNCNSQNKNWTFFSALPLIVNNPETGTEVITIKYFEPGHTFMSADGVHGNINKALKSKSYLGDMEDYVDTINGCRKKIQSIVLDHTDMKQFSNEVKTKQGFKLCDVRVAQFRRGSSKLYTKFSHSQEEFDARDHLKQKAKQSLLTHVRNKTNPLQGIVSMQTRRGIQKKKKDELLLLCSFLPEYKRAFFENIPVCEISEDLEVVRES